MRGIHPDIRSRGAEVVAVGTGDARYARGFVEDERVPFPVLVDDDGTAAEAASLQRTTLGRALGAPSVRAALRAVRRGHRQHRTGRRPLQLGATFVIGPGDTVHYSHREADVSDHAPLADVIGAIPPVRR